MIYDDCTLCPRRCHANRSHGKLGICKQSAALQVARAALHFWEEPCISGKDGSGTIFFTGCSLGCVFCQNHSIASGLAGKKISIERLAEIMLELQEKHANNINLVTPTHFIPSIAEGIRVAKQKGLTLPIIYNTSGYETLNSLQMLDGLIDIYLPDLKYVSSQLSANYSHAPDYFIYASQALKEMYRQTGDPKFNSYGIMTKGIIVRHLLLPGQTQDSKEVIRYLYKTFGNHIYISIMNQYTPMPQIAPQYPELNCRVTQKEYDTAVDYAIDLGVENGFIQEGETADESFIPAFDYEGV